MNVSERPPEGPATEGPDRDVPDAERGLQRVVGVAVLVSALAAVVAGATIWLLLTDPVSVAGAVEGSDLAPLLWEFVAAILGALAALLEWL